MRLPPSVGHAPPKTPRRSHGAKFYSNDSQDSYESDENNKNKFNKNLGTINYHRPNTLGSFLVKNHDVMNKMVKFDLAAEKDYERRDYLEQRSQGLGESSSSISITSSAQDEINDSNHMNSYNGDDEIRELPPRQFTPQSRSHSRNDRYVREQPLPPHRVSPHNNYRRHQRIPTKSLADEAIDGVATEQARTANYERIMGHRSDGAGRTEFKTLSHNHHQLPTIPAPSKPFSASSVETPRQKAIVKDTSLFASILQQTQLCTPINATLSEEAINKKEGKGGFWSSIFDPADDSTTGVSEEDDIMSLTSSFEKSQKRVAWTSFHAGSETFKPPTRRSDHIGASSQSSSSIEGKDMYGDMAFESWQHSGEGRKDEAQYYDSMNELHDSQTLHRRGGGNRDTPSSILKGNSRLQLNRESLPSMLDGQSPPQPSGDNGRRSDRHNTDRRTAPPSPLSVWSENTQNVQDEHHHRDASVVTPKAANRTPRNRSQQTVAGSSPRDNHVSRSVQSDTASHDVRASSGQHPSSIDSQGRKTPRGRNSQYGSHKGVENDQIANEGINENMNSAETEDVKLWRSMLRRKDQQAQSSANEIIRAPHRAKASRRPSSSKESSHTTMTSSPSQNQWPKPPKTPTSGRSSARPPSKSIPSASEKRPPRDETFDNNDHVNNNSMPRAAISEDDMPEDFKQEIDRLVALHFRSMPNLPPEFSDKNDSIIQVSSERSDSKISNLSDESHSEGNLKKQFGKVLCRSGEKNLEWSKDAKPLPENVATKKSTKHPGTPHRANPALLESYSNFIHQPSPSTSRGSEESSYGNRRDRLYDNTSTLSPATDPSMIDEASYQNQQPRETPDQKRVEEDQGYYMYAAYSRFGEKAAGVMQLCEHAAVPTPKPRSNEVLIKVDACTVSASDCSARRGNWPDLQLNPENPFIIPGVAFVGKIHHTEKRSTFQNLKPGDLVAALIKSGGNARYLCIQRDQLVKVPENTDPSKAVCLVENYLAAFQALHISQKTGIRYRPGSMMGQSILILGGSSSLTHALVELALLAGAEFVYVTAREKQFESIVLLGAIPLSRNPQDWLTLVGGQISTIISVSHGIFKEEVNQDHYKALTLDGQVIIISEPGVKDTLSFSSSGSNTTTKLMCTSLKNKLQTRCQFYNVHDQWESDTKQSKRDLSYLLGLLEDGVLHPNVIERIPLSKIAKAQTIIESKRVTGYIVCAPWIKDQRN